MSARSGQVIFLDPSLGAARGHHDVVARNYRALLEAHGRRARFVGHCGGTSDTPVFEHRLEDAFRACRYGAAWMGDRRLAQAASVMKRMLPTRSAAALPEAPRSNGALSADAFTGLFRGLGAGGAIERALRTLEAKSGDDIVVLGVDPAVLTALRGMPLPRDVGLHLLFMYPEADFVGPDVSTAYWLIARDIAQGASVHAELSAHAEQLSAALDRSVGVQITPVRREALPPPPRDGFTVAVLGAGRADKGFADLPAIAAAIQARAPNAMLRIQSPAQGFAREVRALRALSNVTMLPADLSDDAYEAELHGAHVLLLAYDKTRYKSRGSGVLADALIGGRPIICTAHTALAAAISAGNGLAADEAEGFADAVAFAGAGYEALLANAQAEAVRWGDELRRGSVLTALTCAP